MNANEQNEHEAPCPRCGADAEWSYLDENKNRIEVQCPDCGRYEMSKEEFDQVAAENTELTEPNQA